MSRLLKQTANRLIREAPGAEVIDFPRGNRNYRRMRGGGEFAKSLDQRRASELGWITYITAGALGNIHHALAVNAFTMSRQDLKAIDRARALFQLAEDELKAYIRTAMPDQNKSRARRRG